MDEKLRACKQSPKCEVAKDGRCLEGLPLEECTHFFWTLDPMETERSKPDASPVIANVILQSGEELQLENLHSITFRYPTKRIFVIGDSESGKTTLLVRLYNSFQQGPFENFMFAGSNTILGFERRIHKSKLESNEIEERTDKTSSPQFSFLHLAVKHKYFHNPATHLLLSDISGERLKLARDASSEMKELNMLTNADFIIIVIDGEKIKDKKTRMGAIVRSETFLRQALDDRMISPKQKIRIVLSKWDLVESLEEFNYEIEIVQRFKHTFGNRLQNLQFFEICCRSSQPNQVNSAHGVKELLTDWTADESIEVNDSKSSSPMLSTRAMNNFFIM